MVTYYVISSDRVHICHICRYILPSLYIWFKREQVHFLCVGLSVSKAHSILPYIFFAFDWKRLIISHHFLPLPSLNVCHIVIECVCLFILCLSQCKNTFVWYCCSVALLSELVWGWSFLLLLLLVGNVDFLKCASATFFLFLLLLLCVINNYIWAVLQL